MDRSIVFIRFHSLIMREFSDSGFIELVSLVMTNKFRSGIDLPENDIKIQRKQLNNMGMINSKPEFRRRQTTNGRASYELLLREKAGKLYQVSTQFFNRKFILAGKVNLLGQCLFPCYFKTF